MSSDREPKRRNRARLFFLIFGLLLAMVVSPFFPFGVRTNYAHCCAPQHLADFQTFRLALYIFKSEVGRFPTTEEGLAALVLRPQGDGLASWKPTMEAELLDPWGSRYSYRYPPVESAAGFPEVFSAGPDGVFGTGDDIGSWEGR